MLVFGKGLHAFNLIREKGKDSPQNILHIEEGAGMGYVGVVKPEHFQQYEVDLKDLNKEGHILLKFENCESVQTLIDALENIKASLSEEKNVS